MTSSRKHLPSSTGREPYRSCLWCENATPCLPDVPQAFVGPTTLACSVSSMVRSALDLWQCPRYMDMPEATRIVRVQRRQKMLCRQVDSWAAAEKQRVIDDIERRAGIEEVGLVEFYRRKGE